MRRLKYYVMLLACSVFWVTCGTEIGNPSPADKYDFNDAVGFVGANSKLKSSGQVAKTRSLSEQAATPVKGNILLYKYTAVGELLPVIDLKPTDLTSPTYISKIAKIDERFYILFSGNIDLGTGACSLIEVTLPKTFKCIDSLEIPAWPMYEDFFKTKEANQKDLMVAKDSQGNIYYRSKNAETSLNTWGSKLAVLHPDGTRENLITNSREVFSSLIQAGDGSLYALHYFSVLDPFGNGTGAVKVLHEYCKLTGGACVSMLDPNITVKVDRYIPLKDHKLLFVSYDETLEPFHLRLGTVGKEVNLTNFNTDLKTNTGFTASATENIFSAFVTDQEKLYAIRAGLAPEHLVQLSPSFEALTNDSAEIDYRPGQKIISTFQDGVRSLDPSNNQFKKLNFPKERIFSLRYVTDDVVLFSTLPNEGSKQTGLNIYRYFVSQDSYEKLLETSDYSYIVSVP